MSILTFLITISIVVVFHEYGHYLAARYYQVHVERFSVGFGKVLYRRIDKKGTEWVISMLPLGGYVKPLSEPRPEHPHYKQGESIEEKTPWEKLVIYAAGPAFSFLLGIIIYTCSFVVGEEQPQAILAKPAIHSIAEKAGLEQGDKVLAVNDREIQSWQEFIDYLSAPITLGQEVSLRAENSFGRVKEMRLSFPAYTGELEKVNLFQEAGLELNAPQALIQRVIEGGVASQAGLKADDIVVRINNQEVSTIQALIKTIQQSADQALTLTVKREGTLFNVNVIPTPFVLEDGRQIGRIQAEFRPNYPMSYVRYNPIDAVLKALHKTWNTAWASVQMMGKMLVGELSVKNLSGPITIADYSGKVAQHGFMQFIQFIALISVSIGVLNLLPIPGLDGGQMVINFVEMIRGKPLPESILKNMMFIGYGLLFVLMFFALNNDLNRLFQ